MRTLVLISILASSQPLLAQTAVSPVFATGEFPGANVDSCAVWAAPPGQTSLLFVTEKDGDRVQVWDAATGRPHEPMPFLGGALDSADPGEFDRPNGVWVIDHVPTAGGFEDILLVTDQRNLRVQIFSLPRLEYFGEFGTGEIGKGYGIAWYQDGADFFVFITDGDPPLAFPGKIKKYRLRPEGELLGADLVLSFGSADGSPRLSSVESMLADAFHDRLHVCGDEGGDVNRIFRLDGSPTGIAYGEPQFENDQEGINLYDTGFGGGYLVVSDQYRFSANEFEIFDRVTLEPLGNFRSAPGELVTENTDGTYLQQRSLDGFPNGAFYAVNDDRNLHAYDWTDIAESLDLEIVPLDRPFSVSPAGDETERSVARNLLWFHDGSWWGVLPTAGPDALGPSICRLEGGTFVPRRRIRGEVALAVESSGDALWVVTSGEDQGVGIERLLYRASLRGYEPSRRTLVPGARGTLVDLAVEGPGRGEVSRVWIAWVDDGSLRVLSSDESLLDWDADAIVLGEALAVMPRLVRLADATALLWSRPDRVSLRLHDDLAPPTVWMPEETVSPVPAAGLALAATAEGELIMASLLADDALWLRRRFAAGGLSVGKSLPAVGMPALVVDDAGRRAHLFGALEQSGLRQVHHLVAPAASLDFSDPTLLVGWPGVDMGALSSARHLPAGADAAVVVSLGSDRLGHFGRVQRPGRHDRRPPITLEHTPPPGAEGVEEEATITFRLVDDRSGVDRSTLRLLVNGAQVTPSVRGVARNLLVSVRLPAGARGVVRVRIEADDLDVPPRSMTPFEYELTVGPGDSPRFLRGDANGDGVLDISDAIRMLLVLFNGFSPAGCLDVEDANDDGTRDIADPGALLGFLFLGGPPLPPPFPNCGADRTEDGLECLATATACQ